MLRRLISRTIKSVNLIIIKSRRDHEKLWRLFRGKRGLDVRELASRSSEQQFVTDLFGLEENYYEADERTTSRHHIKLFNDKSSGFCCFIRLFSPFAVLCRPSRIQNSIPIKDENFFSFYEEINK